MYLLIYLLPKKYYQRKSHHLLSSRSHASSLGLLSDSFRARHIVNSWLSFLYGISHWFLYVLVMPVAQSLMEVHHFVPSTFQTERPFGFEPDFLFQNNQSKRTNKFMEVVRFPQHVIVKLEVLSYALGTTS